MKKLKLAHLYPKLLNIYGDIGNIITLKKRCEWRGIELEIDEEKNYGDIRRIYLDVESVELVPDIKVENVEINVSNTVTSTSDDVLLK